MSRPDSEQTPLPIGPDESLLEFLGSADESLDEVADGQLGEWDALAARLEMVSSLVEPPQGPGDRATPEISSTRLGRYQIVEEIGAGGFGIVFLAIDTRLDRMVALKVPRPELMLTPRMRARFLREAKTASRLDHAGIVRVLDAGSLGPACYIASAYCNGPDLAAWLRNRTELVPFRLAAQLVLRIAQAAQHAHERGILHRDIKPSNVLLHPEPDSGLGVPASSFPYVPRLGDFGLARLMEPDSADPAFTRSHMPLGSPPYMSPEQAGGRTDAIGPETDVYSLGVVLHELVTGRPPLVGETNVETLRLVCEAEPVAPGVLRRGTPRALETIIQTCLRKDPERRYRSAAALAADLARFLADEPILARPIGLFERSLQMTRRHPAVAMAIATLVLAIAASAGLGVWWNGQLRAHARALEAERDRADRIRYASQLQLARRTRDEGQLGRSQNMLRELADARQHAPQHDFAWQYLWNSAQREALLLGEMESNIRNAAVSKDWKRLALADGEGGLSVFELGNTRPIWKLRNDHNRLVDALAIDPTNSWLAVAWGVAPTEGQTIRSIIELFRLETGERVLRWSTNQPDLALERLAFLESDRLLTFQRALSNRSGSTVECWQLSLGPNPRATLVRKRTGLAGQDITADGQRLLAFSWPGPQLVVCDGRSLETTHILDAGEEEATGQPRFTAGDQLVAAGQTSRKAEHGLSLWRVEDGERLFQTGGFAAPVHQVVVNRARTAAIAMEQSGGVTLINLGRGDRTPVFEASGEPESVFSATATFLADGSGFLIDRANKLEPPRVERRAIGDARVLGTCPIAQLGAFSLWSVIDVAEQGGPGIVLTMGRAAWLWRTGAEESENGNRAVQHRDEAWSVAFSPDGKLLATGSNDSTETQTVRIWRPEDGRLLRGWKAHDATVTGVSFSIDGRMLATCALEGEVPVRVWEPTTGALLRTLAWPSGGARSVSFDPSGRWLAAAGSNGTVQIWSVRDWKPVAHIRAHSDRVHGLAFSRTGQELATVSDDGGARLWAVPSGKLLREHHQHQELFDVRFSPDGQTLAVAGRSGVITLLDPAHFQVLAEIRSDDSDIRALGFSPNSRTLAAGGVGRAVRLWDVGTGQELLTLTDAQGQINAIQFDRNGWRLAACDHSGRIWIYDGKPDPRFRSLEPAPAKRSGL